MKYLKVIIHALIKSIEMEHLFRLAWNSGLNSKSEYRALFQRKIRIVLIKSNDEIFSLYFYNQKYQAHAAIFSAIFSFTAFYSNILNNFDVLNKTRDNYGEHDTRYSSEKKKSKGKNTTNEIATCKTMK